MKPWSEVLGRGSPGGRSVRGEVLPANQLVERGVPDEIGPFADSESADSVRAHVHGRGSFYVRRAEFPLEVRPQLVPKFVEVLRVDVAKPGPLVVPGDDAAGSLSGDVIEISVGDDGAGKLAACRRAQLDAVHAPQRI